MSAQVSNGSTKPLITIPGSTSASADAGLTSHSCRACVGTVRTWSTARFHRGEAVTRPDATLGTQLIGIANTTPSKSAPLFSSIVATFVLARPAYHDSYRRSSGDGAVAGPLAGRRRTTFGLAGQANVGAGRPV